MEKNVRYLKQALVVRKDLCMPTGKVGAMVGHAVMTFIAKRRRKNEKTGAIELDLTPDQDRWLIEMDPGLEDIGQISAAKIVLEVNGEEELKQVFDQAKAAGLETHPVYDCGYSHNKPRTFVAIGIGPDWPENLAPVTGNLKIYR